MFGLSASKRILLFTGETDLRKGYDGLAALVSAAGENVYGGDLFVFVSSRRTSAKILLWQTGGMMIVQNQPSSHYTSFDFRREPCFFAGTVRMAAARSTSRSHRLLCFVGRSTGSS
jgi:hypothetical protein